MKELLNDVTTAIGNLSNIDMILLAALLALFILIFITIYLMRGNAPIINEVNISNEEFDNNLDEEITIPDEPKVASAPIIINDNKKQYLYDDEDTAIIDLSTLKKKMDSIPNNVTLDQYEKEQEDTAIISYEELLKRHNLDQHIEYMNDNKANAKTDDELLVKQVNVEEATKTRENVVISLAEEENFLNMLQQLQKSLN